MSLGPGSSAALSGLRKGMDYSGDLRLLVTDNLKLSPSLFKKKKKLSLKFTGSRILLGFRDSLEDGLEKLSLPDRLASFH